MKSFDYEKYLRNNPLLKEAVDMDNLEFELKLIKKQNPGKKVTYFFTKDNPKGYIFLINGKAIKDNK